MNGIINHFALQDLKQHLLDAKKKIEAIDISSNLEIKETLLDINHRISALDTSGDLQMLQRDIVLLGGELEAFKNRSGKLLLTIVRILFYFSVVVIGELAWLIVRH